MKSAALDDVISRRKLATKDAVHTAKTQLALMEMSDSEKLVYTSLLDRAE
jgi:hypothetical protein